jgi:L-ribulose-5-phosphate 3-epimerase UlaE
MLYLGIGGAERFFVLDRSRKFSAWPVDMLVQITIAIDTVVLLHFLDTIGVQMHRFERYDRFRIGAVRLDDYPTIFSHLCLLEGEI